MRLNIEVNVDCNHKLCARNVLCILQGFCFRFPVGRGLEGGGLYRTGGGMARDALATFHECQSS